jgi:hypothetical protein
MAAKLRQPRAYTDNGELLRFQWNDQVKCSGAGVVLWLQVQLHSAGRTICRVVLELFQLSLVRCTTVYGTWCNSQLIFLIKALLRLVLGLESISITFFLFFFHGSKS